MTLEQRILLFTMAKLGRAQSPDDRYFIDLERNLREGNVWSFIEEYEDACFPDFAVSNEVRFVRDCLEMWQGIEDANHHFDKSELPTSTHLALKSDGHLRFRGFSRDGVSRKVIEIAKELITQRGAYPEFSSRYHSQIEAHPMHHLLPMTQLYVERFRQKRIQGSALSKDDVLSLFEFLR